ncbi:transcription antitermination factor NusB [Lapillicoccus sp.]|uniref:transcription antitermination factor NusB n=1 Tax=Lapillicoccus sp. TaxID=1909287 RepID=UPI0025FE18C8|nr:transcription antitermination factor NusB [Lapillicoccus sp.]
MAARSKARKRALDLLFEADQRGLNAQNLLAERLSGKFEGPSPNEYTIEIVEGVVGRWGEINDLLSTYSQGWTIERMPGVDRAILRIGAWEVVWNDAVPDAVAISEAVALAKSLSTDDSPSFVNGLLARLSEVKPTLV